jgi:pimeloyl-ACP methyl ester carboxylesterase
MMELSVPKAAGGSLRLVYDDTPPPGPETGPPVLLIHGFASSRRTNWVSTSWMRTLAAAGRRVIAFDHRGHGESEASHDPADYDEGLLAGDAARVLTACGVRSADIVGYSMGAMVAIRLLIDCPYLVNRAVLAGLGENYLTKPDFSDDVPAALLADDTSTVTNRAALTFRVFADSQKADRFALAACWRRPRTVFDPHALAQIERPVMVICGEKDAVTGRPDRLAAAIPGAVMRIVPGKDHMSAVGAPMTKTEVTAFLSA